VIKTADWIVDLGPEGGDQGGEILFCGPPEALVEQRNSHTGRFLRPLLELAEPAVLASG
jgi:excinuclease ABC subunit A